MQIILNGQIIEVPQPCNLADLLAQQQLTGRRLAIEVNQELVPRSQFADYQLAANDRVEIIQAVGGG
ncbi:sulfur carrier protein ThiS [Rhodoferax sp. 4810]|uniref:Sulfur carrier protein ThiS n=1 Tax=Thiospirillum jenense TaxID=1653858 RepID=A0A839HBR0_9GAMM|nr:sulfur carrier protein ThiS [Thiospirillum jenense]MBB1076556.1 sulfur carrier protein ThiS [Rhodoferax jenense]MBB1124738.1 sulfur carrier protein ThiS [Thiospirillum jenense]